MIIYLRRPPGPVDQPPPAAAAAAPAPAPLVQPQAAVVVQTPPDTVPIVDQPADDDQPPGEQTPLLGTENTPQ